MAFTLFRSDLERRLRPTFLGWAWYLAPLLTAVAVSGMPGNLTGQGSNISQFLQVTLYVCALQLVTDIGHEAARIVRRNRPLLPAVGENSIVFNLAGTISAVSQFLLKISVFSLFFCFLSEGRETLATRLVNLFSVLPLICILGFALSFVFAYPSLLFLDLRYGAPYLPMLLVILSPSVAPLNETYNLISLISPLSILSLLSSPGGLEPPDWIFGAITTQSILLSLVCLGFAKLQTRIAAVIVTNYV